MASAIVGTLKVLLEANAAKLDSEFAKATVTVGNFDKFTANAGRSLTRMVESFSGARIVAEAQKMAAAVEQVGGVSALTERELRRVQASVDAAADKLTRLGVAVPPAIANVKREIDALGLATQTATAATGGLTGALQRLAPLASTLGVGFSAFAAINFGKQLLADADALTKLSDKTGIGIEAIQRLKYIAEQSGNTLDQVTAAVSQLQNRLAEGDKSAVGALRALGLTFQELKSLSPDQQLEAIARQVAAIEDPMERTRLATELFGKAGAEILPTLIADFDKLGAAAPRMSEKAVKAFADIGDAIDHAWTVAKTATGEGVAAAIDGYTRLWQISEALMTGAFAKVPEILLDLGTMAPTIKAPVNALAQAVEGVGLSMTEMDRISDALTHSIKDGLADAARKAAAAQRELERETERAARAQQAFNDSVKTTRRILGEIPLQPLKAALEGVNLENLAAGFESNGTIIVNSLTDAAAETAAAEKATLAWANAHAAVLKPAVMEVRAALDGVAQQSTSWGATITGGLQASLQQLGPTILGAVQGGGSVVSSIGSLFGQGLGGSIAKAAGPAFANLFGKTIGGALESVLPGVGALLGPLLSKVFGMFGPSKEVLEARKNLEALEKSLRDSLTAEEKAEAGGRGWAETLIRVRRAMLAVGGSAADAERLVAQLFDTDHPAAAAAALAQVNDLLEQEADLAQQAADAVAAQEQAFNDAKAAAHDLVGEIEGLVASSGMLPEQLEPYIAALEQAGLLTADDAATLRGLQAQADAVNFQHMQDAIELFHGRIVSLGPAFQNQRIGQVAAQYVNALDVMIRGGADVGGVLFDAREELSALVQDAIANKTKLPAQLRPYIQELERTGQLLDAEGHKIENVADLEFGEPIKTEAEIAREGFDKILQKIDELIAKITGPLEQALDGLTQDRTADINVRINKPPGDPGVDLGDQRLFTGDRNLPLSVPTPLPTGPSAGTVATLNAGLTVPAVSTAAAASLAGAPPIVVLPMLPVTDPYQAAEEAASQFRQRVGVDSHGMRESIETVVDDWLRTYYQPR